MKITINGSPKELAELMSVLFDTEPEAKKAKLGNDENVNLFFGHAHGQTGDEIAETIRRNRDTISVIKKMNEVAKQRKENAPQVETTERYIPFIHFKPRFEERIKIVKEANEDA